MVDPPASPAKPISLFESHRRLRIKFFENRTSQFP